MQKWEYKTIQLRLEESKQKKGGFFSLRAYPLSDLGKSSETELSELGSEGWELVSVIPVEPHGVGFGTGNALAFLKRNKQ